LGSDPDAVIADILAQMDRERPDSARLRLTESFGGTLPRLAGVVGWPLDHSLSPALHNGWLRRYHISGRYLKLPLSPENFKAGIKLLQHLGFRGVNVTIPHKEDAFQIATRLTEIARRCGSANTLVFGDDGEIFGDSTDGTGFCENLRAHGVALHGRALILGAGGAARAICAALMEKGSDVSIANRSVTRAKALSAQLHGLRHVSWDDWPSHLGAVDLLVNTTSLGMQGAADYDWESALSKARDDLSVADIVYVPLETSLLRQARRRGLRTVDGLGMLIEQARVGFRTWFGKDPQADDATRRALLGALG